MTNDQLLYIFKQNLDQSEIAALRGVYNAGYCEGAGVTPSATLEDFSRSKAAPAAVVKIRRPD
jgi:hypothetical protein